MNNNSKISIITVVYNGEKYLEETIQSVVNQSYNNIEYIIIDGGSTDGTLDIIKKYENNIDYWISEIDKGIYDAINKGISVAKGEYIGVIGADDIYYKDALKHIADYIEKNKNTDLIYGNISYIDENGSIIKSKRSSLPKDKLFMIKGMSIPHIASFVKKSIYEKYGKYDVSMKCASDYQYFLNLYLENISIKYLDVYISKFRNTGVTNNNIIQSNWEVFKIRQKYKVNIVINIYYFLRTVLSKFIR